MSLLGAYGPTALVTGGTSGIGLALAQELARGGFDLHLVARDAARLEDVARDLRGHGVTVTTTAADLATRDGVLQVLADAPADVGFAVLNAGAVTTGPLHEADAEAEARQLRVNVEQTARLAHHFATHLAPRGRGGILLVSSLYGLAPVPFLADYAASKAFVRFLGLALRRELRPFGVDVTVLAPGPVATPMLDGTGLDPARMGMKVMPPEALARKALRGMGRPLVVPGLRNRIMARMMGWMSAPVAAWMMYRMHRRQLGT